MPSPSPADLPHSGIKPESLTQEGGFFTTEPPGKPLALMGCLLLPRLSAVYIHTGSAWAGWCLPDQYQVDTEDMIRILEG